MQRGGVGGKVGGRGVWEGLQKESQNQEVSSSSGGFRNLTFVVRLTQAYCF